MPKGMPRKTTWVNLGIRSGVQNPLTYQTTAQHCTLYIQNDVPCTSSPATFYLIGSILLILQRFVLLLDLQLFFRYHKKHLFIYSYAHKEPHEKRILPSSVLRENTHSHLGGCLLSDLFSFFAFPLQFELSILFLRKYSRVPCSSPNFHHCRNICFPFPSNLHTFFTLSNTRSKLNFSSL